MSTGADPDIISRLKFMGRDRTMVSHKDCVGLKKETGLVTIPADQLSEIHKCACIQRGRWEAEWMFSSSNAPNSNAEAQLDGWDLICKGIYDSIEKACPQPGLLAILKKERGLHSMRASLEKNLTYGETRPIEHFLMRSLCKCGQFLTNIGLKEMGRKVFARGFYPKGTVGRVTK